MRTLSVDLDALLADLPTLDLDKLLEDLEVPDLDLADLVDLVSPPRW